MTAPETALIVVDMQPDFMAGGALPVPAGDELVRPVAELMVSGRYRTLVATQDWHPRGHISFASAHAGHKPFETVTCHGQPQALWPDHCVQGTPGAALHAGLPTAPVSLIIRKGTDPQVDSYSAFRNNWNAAGQRPPTGLTGYLRELGVSQVHVCGLARDFCVLWTALDAAEAGFPTTFLWSLTRAVFAQNDAQTRATLQQQGIAVQDM